MERKENTKLDGGTARKKCKTFSGEIKRKEVVILSAGVKGNTELGGGTARKKTKTFKGELKRRKNRDFGGKTRKKENKELGGGTARKKCKRFSGKKNKEKKAEILETGWKG